MQTLEWINRVNHCTTRQEQELVRDEIMSLWTPDNPPFLSDLIVNLSNGGQRILEWLGDLTSFIEDVPEDNRLRWHIQVLCGEFGEVPKPGFIVERKMQINMYNRDGTPVSGTEISRSKIDGSFERRFVRKVAYRIDNKGCISCGFRDAMHFLTTFGKHSRTGYALTTKPEVSYGPTPYPGGGMRHVHYWRYQEVDSDQYAQLPLLDIAEKKEKR